MEYKYVIPHGVGWIKASPSAIGDELWVKTSDHGVILPDDEIPGLVSFLQAYMSRRARELSKGCTR